MDEYGQMMAAHDALETGVYLVEIFLKGEFVKHGIFSNSQKARDWMHTFSHDHDCLCAPFVLDSPEYGDKKKEEMQ